MLWPGWIDLLSRNVQSFPKVKGQHRFRGKVRLFLAGESRACCTGRGARTGSDERAPAASRKATDERAQTGTASDKRQISFLMSSAAAPCAVRDQGYRCSIDFNRIQRDAQIRTAFESAGRRGTSYNTFNICSCRD